MKLWSPRSLTNAICFPSGDHFGSVDCPRTTANSLAACLPSTLHSHNFFFADQIADLPSGEISTSSQPSSPQPISPNSLGEACLASTSNAKTCCLAPFVELLGLALSCASFS